MTSINISVVIVDDDIVEGNQSLTGNLDSPVGPVLLSPAVATVTITDDAPDGKYLDTSHIRR